MKLFLVEVVCLFLALTISLAWLFLILWLSSRVVPYLPHFLRFVVDVFAISLVLGSIPIARRGYRTMKAGWERRLAKAELQSERN
jgi:hypothetical protein